MNSTSSSARRATRLQTSPDRKDILSRDHPTQLTNAEEFHSDVEVGDTIVEVVEDADLRVNTKGETREATAKVAVTTRANLVEVECGVDILASGRATFAEVDHATQVVGIKAEKSNTTNSMKWREVMIMEIMVVAVLTVAVHSEVAGVVEAVVASEVDSAVDSVEAIEAAVTVCVEHHEDSEVVVAVVADLEDPTWNRTVMAELKPLKVCHAYHQRLKQQENKRISYQLKKKLVMEVLSHHNCD